MRLILLALGLVLGSCAGSPPSPAGTVNGDSEAAATSSPSSTGAVSEAEFIALHEHTDRPAPPARGQMVDVDGMRAYLSLPEDREAPMPAVLVIHEWWGLNEHIRHWADRLAAEGYAALAVDLYEGQTTTDPERAMELMQAVDEASATAKLEAAHRFLLEDPRVRAPRTAVIGWCFGGGWALRAGMAVPELDAVVMYYGRLVEDPAELRAIEAPLLGIFAKEDTTIPPEQVDVFDRALDQANVEHTILRYDADHAFANPSGERYDREAAEDAWAQASRFLARHLGPTGAAESVQPAGGQASGTSSARRHGSGSPPTRNLPEAVCELVERGYGPEGEAPVRAQEVVSGLEVPWGILFLGGGDMLVTERPGRLRLVRDGELIDAPVATIDVIARGEGGLLGIERHPDFADDRLFYLYLTAREGRRAENRVELWRLGPDARSASRERVLLDGIPVGALHNGGRIRLGPDGMLYVATGDARDADRAQDRESLAGKILRLTPEGEIPPDNPFRGSPVWVLGVRNVQGFDWRDEDTMLVADHGPSGDLGRSGHDEVAVATAGTNLGWPRIYGCRDAEEMRPPSLTWRSAVPPGGAAIYTGDRIPQWRGLFVVGTLGSKHLHTVRFDPSAARVAEHAVYFRGDPPRGLGRIRETIMGPDGELYVTTSNCDGRGTCPADGDKIVRVTAGETAARP